MTPEEAQKRWCPMAAKNPDNQRCIADDCMAWRWSWSPEQAARARRAFESAPLPTSPPTTKPNGYCGLAGAHGN